MSEYKNIILLFCEGDSDAALTHLVFKHVLDAKEVHLAYNDYPGALAGAIKKTITDTRFDGCQDGDPVSIPYCVYEYQQWLILVIKLNGHEFKKEIQNLIKVSSPKGLNGLQFTSGQKIQVVRYVFVFDADDVGITKRLASFVDDFGKIEGFKEWYIEPDISESSGNWQIRGNKGIFIWADKDGFGTIEAVTKDFMGQFTGFPLQDAIAFCNDHLTCWPFKDNPPKVPEEAWRLKMALTIAGQYHRPGKALPTIIQDCLKTLQAKKDKDIDENKKSIFVKQEPIKEYAEFLRKMCGLE